MTKEFKLSFLLVLGTFGSIIVFGLIYPILDLMNDSHDLIFNMITMLPYLFALIFPILLYREVKNDNNLTILAYVLIFYAVIQAFLVFFNDYSMEGLYTSTFGFIGLLVSAVIIVLSILSNINFGISKGFMFVIIGYSVVLLFQNISIMEYFYDRTGDFEILNRYIVILMSNQFLMKDVILLLVQILIIDQLLRK